MLLMFTGIVEELGKVKNISRGHSSIQLTIECSLILDDVGIGDSIAVNGICLTVTDLGTTWFSADVMPETMRKTGLGSLGISQQVNLERALSLIRRLGGHIVSGHIDGTGRIRDINHEGNARWLNIEASGDILKYMVLKGSVALDGTSLTVAKVSNTSFSVSLISLTQGVTTLGSKKAGDIVNIECDILGKYIEKLILKKSEADVRSKDISLDFLKENGFL